MENIESELHTDCILRVSADGTVHFSYALFLAPRCRKL
jgi:hypothetical protein